MNQKLNKELNAITKNDDISKKIIRILEIDAIIDDIEDEIKDETYFSLINDINEINTHLRFQGLRFIDINQYFVKSSTFIMEFFIRFVEHGQLLHDTVISCKAFEIEEMFSLTAKIDNHLSKVKPFNIIKVVETLPHHLIYSAYTSHVYLLRTLTNSSISDKRIKKMFKSSAYFLQYIVNSLVFEFEGNDVLTFKKETCIDVEYLKKILYEDNAYENV